MVSRLLDRGANADAKDNEGYTPLMAAVKTGNLEIIKMLIEKGADVNARDKDGWTAMLAAYDRSDVKELLKKHGAKDTAF